DDAVGRIARASEELTRLVEHDPRLAELHRRLAELGVLAADLAGDLSGYAADIEVDPARLGVVEERRAALTDLTRRYGEDVEAVLAHRDAARERLLTLEGADERIGVLTARVEELVGRLTEAVEILTAARTVAA